MLVHSMYNCAAVFAIGIAMMANAAAPVLGVHGVQDAKGQLVVDQVFSGTGAEKADLRPGDVILSYNDVAVSDFRQLVSLVRAGKVGNTVRIEVIREGARFERQIMLGTRREASRRPTAPAR
jgi:S1-C subfamily serine protease